jgi:NADPH:quinone reductase-like Zn-dependent oxidoreductase
MTELATLDRDLDPPTTGQSSPGELDMRAIGIAEHADPVLQMGELDGPGTVRGELLVRVAATGVNYLDVYAGEGRRPYARILPFVPGSEGADTVVGLGNGVDGAAVERQALDHKEAT